MPDQDLSVQLEGLFAGVIPEPEAAAEEADLLLEQTIVDLLEVEGKAEVKPVAVELAAMEIPPLVPAELEKVEREEPELAPVDFLAWEAQLQEQRIRTLNIMLGSLAGLGTVVIIAMLINLVQEPSRWLQVYAPYFAAYLALMALAVARRINPTVRATVLVALAYGVGIAALLTEGPLSAGGLYLLAAPLLFAVLVRQQAGVVAAVVSSLIYTGFLLADHQGWLHPSAPYRPEVLPSVLSLISTFVLITAGVMFVQRMFSHTLTSALREAELKHDESLRARSLLEERADELGSANALLQKRTFQLQTVAQVSSAATFSVLDSDELAQQVVDLIQNRFDLYYVGLFLADPPYPPPGAGGDRGGWASLQAGTGEAGRQMLALDYKIQVDTSSTVGWCIVNAQARIALDASAIHLTGPNEHVKAARLLPGTRSEMALPLRSRGQTIGALTLRSAERDAFSQDDIPMLQTMADQIAVAIDNARLFAEAQANLKEMEEIQRHYVREQWAGFLSTQAAPIYERTQPDVTPLGDTMPPEVEQAMAQRKAVVQSDTGNGAGPAALVVPISLRDEAIGAARERRRAAVDGRRNRARRSRGGPDGAGAGERPVVGGSAATCPRGTPPR
jgi:GAF domain-containing protein